MPIGKGDLVYIDYIGRIKETNEVFDTTIEEEAKKAGIFDEKQVYEPILVAIGKNWVVEGLEEALIGREAQVEFEVEVPPEKGFGRRDSKKIVIYNKKRLLSAGLKEEPRPGSIITVNGLPAIVRTVSGSRVLLDFNPPLAGKTLLYKVHIRSICKSIPEKIDALVKRRSRALSEKKGIYRYNAKRKILEFRLGEEEARNMEIATVKKDIAADIFEFIPEVRKVRFVEEFIHPAVKEERMKKSKSPIPQ